MSVGSGKNYSTPFWRSYLGGGFGISCLDGLQFAGQLANQHIEGHSEYDAQYFRDVFTVPSPKSRYTRGGLERIDYDGEVYFDKGGNTGRGEWGFMSVNPKRKVAVFIYANMNYPDGEFNLGLEVNSPFGEYLRKGRLPPE